MDVSEDKIDSLIDNANTHCFKRGLTADEYFNYVDNVCALSDNLGMPLDELPNHIIQEQLELVKVRGETKDAKLKQLQVLQGYNVNMNDLQEYIRNKPLVETIKSQQNKLEKAEIHIDNLEKELLNEQTKNFRIKYSLLISEYELNEANILQIVGVECMSELPLKFAEILAHSICLCFFNNDLLG